ncbi:solute carrier family 36 member pathetic isoform X1 [Rhodnius prolixus]
MTSNGTPAMTELETFLPQDGSKYKDGKYKLPTISKDLELCRDTWDPFKERKVEHPTTDCDTLTHLLKAALGTGILAMPFAFMNAGLSFGIFLTVLVSVVCTHCAYVLIKCAHTLYRRLRVSSMTFPDVGEVAFANGPPWGRKFAKLIRMAIIGGLFGAYFGTCSVYTVIIARNFQQVVEHYTETVYNDRLCISLLLVPLIILSWVPNLKYLAPISMVANFFMGFGLGITLYYLVWDLPAPSTMPQIGSIVDYPQFFSITIFAMEAIGVMMPLENNMKTPQHFLGICGVLNMGMSGVTLVYVLLGFLGYLKYGENTYATITLNLPTEEYAAQSVKILVALAVFCTYGLQYFVCLELVWDAVKDKFTKKKTFYEYVVRTILTFTTVAVAVAVPQIGPFLGLIGALCFSLLGIVIPALIEIVTYWDTGLGRCYWIVWKNILVGTFGLLALGFGSYTSIVDIISEYLGEPEPMVIPPYVMSEVNKTVHDAFVLVNSTLLGRNGTTP